MHHRNDLFPHASSLLDECFSFVEDLLAEITLGSSESVFEFFHALLELGDHFRLRIAIRFPLDAQSVRFSFNV